MQVVEYYQYVPAGTSLWGPGYTLLPWSGDEERAGQESCLAAWSGTRGRFRVHVPVLASSSLLVVLKYLLWCCALVWNKTKMVRDQVPAPGFNTLARTYEAV